MYVYTSRSGVFVWVLYKLPLGDGGKGINDGKKFNKFSTYKSKML